MEDINGPFLPNINYPADLKQYKEQDLEQIAQELRQYIIDVVSVNGGDRKSVV